MACICLVALCCCSQETPSVSTEIISLFDGKTLTGWEGNPDYFRVADGTMQGGATIALLDVIIQKNKKCNASVGVA